MKQDFAQVGPFRCVIVALLLVSSAELNAQSVSISLDDADQVTAAPAIGTLTLDFTGTVEMSPFLTLVLPTLDSPVNDTNTFGLIATLDPAFATFLTTFGTFYDGRVFTVDVPAGTPAGLYGFSAFGGPSELEIVVRTPAGGSAVDNAPFSVQVVPEPASAVVIVLGGIALLASRRMRA